MNYSKFEFLNASLLQNQRAGDNHACGIDLYGCTYSFEISRALWLFKFLHNSITGGLQKNRL